MLTHKDLWLKGVQDSVSDALRRQCTDPSDRFYGTIEGVAGGYTNPHSALYTARTFLQAYYCDGQKYFHDPLMLERSIPALEYALRLQHGSDHEIIIHSGKGPPVKVRRDPCIGSRRTWL